jgi:transcriptional regulator with XRE-family HTH domain
MQFAGILLSAARHNQGVSTRTLAALAGASQPGIDAVERGHKDASTARLARLLTVLGYQLTVLPTRLSAAWRASDEIRHFLANQDPVGALRVIWQLAADLNAAEPPLRVALCVTPPPSTGDQRYDALIAAVVDHELTRDHLPRPRWLDEPWRTLDTPWDLEPVASLRPEARDATPPAIAARGIYLDAAELVNL